MVRPDNMNTDINTDINVGGILSLLPKAWRPYGQLMRLDRPIGWWLLLLPSWWALLTAGIINAIAFGDSLKLMGLFLLGSIVMRGAGCVVNDLWDRDLDRTVARTRSRALAAGTLTPAKALVFLAALATIGLIILLQLPPIAIWTGIASLPLIIIYPLAKRLIALPQIILALTFSWGAWLGWTAHDQMPTLITAAIYLATAFWIFGYDTIYAIQDIEDDRIAKIKSSALTLGKWLPLIVAICYLVFCLGLLVAGTMRDAHLIYYVGLVILAFHLSNQVKRIDLNDPESAKMLFKSNRNAGLIIVAVLLAEYAI